MSSLLRSTVDNPNRAAAAYDRNRIGIPTHEGIEMVMCKDIIRCEALRARCTFYLVDGRTIEVNKSLGFYESKLTEWNFFKMHKSHLVNLHHVESFISGKDSYVTLSNQEQVPVAVRKRAELHKRFRFSPLLADPGLREIYDGLTA